MEFQVDHLKIKIFGDKEAKVLVLMNENQGEGEMLWNCLGEEVKNTMMLACIAGVSWEHDLTPWEAPALFKKADPFTGGADAYLEVIKDKILPEIKNRTNQEMEEIYLAGYSLAGLFAVYSGIKTDCFDGFVSASGSLWYPDFLAFAKEHPVSQKIKYAYFSVGDKEAKTRNQMMQPVEENTRKIEEMVNAQGVCTRFDLNPGGHFVDDFKRLAKGIQWLMEQRKNPG